MEIRGRRAGGAVAGIQGVSLLAGAWEMGQRVLVRLWEGAPSFVSPVAGHS
jgi:hypothetical protein